MNKIQHRLSSKMLDAADIEGCNDISESDWSGNAKPIKPFNAVEESK